jgi:hypothetical protein
VATGVNVQHDLARIIGGRFPDTKQLHEAAAHHAADGALPITLAALGDVSGFYTSGGKRARSLEEAAKLVDAKVHHHDHDHHHHHDDHHHHHDHHSKELRSDGDPAA